MKNLDFILSSPEAMNAIKELACTEGATVNGAEWLVKNRPSNAQATSKLEKASEEELSAMLEACGFGAEEISAPARISADEVVIDLSIEDVGERTSADGSKYDVVLAEMIGESNAGFNFKLKSGGIITVTGDRMFQLWSAGGLTEGYKMPFKPESVRPSEYIGYFNGVPNFGADERLTKVLNANRTNQKLIRAKVAEIRSYKLPKNVQDQKINDLVNDVIEAPKLVKIKF